MMGVRFPLPALYFLLLSYLFKNYKFLANKGETNPLVWIGLNAYSKSIEFPLPECKYNWLKVIDTSKSGIFEPLTINKNSVLIESRSSILIISEEVFKAKNNLF